MNSAELAARLRGRAARLAGQLARQARERLVQRWQARGVAVREKADGVTLAAPGLTGRRQGTRTRLPDADFLWPED